MTHQRDSLIASMLYLFAVPFYFLLPFFVGAISFGYYPEWEKGAWSESLASWNGERILTMFILHFYAGFASCTILLSMSLFGMWRKESHTTGVLIGLALAVSSLLLSLLALWTIGGFWFPLKFDFIAVQVVLFASFICTFFALRFARRNLVRRPPTKPV